MSSQPVVTLPDAAATHDLGRRFGVAARRGDVLLLEGDLGAGKTTLAQGLAAGLGVTGPVTSPTFALQHDYRGRLALAHLDLYRLALAEVASMGLAEAWLDPAGVVVIEWPERLAGQLQPDDALHVRLAAEGDARSATFVGATGRGLAWWQEAAGA